MIRAKTKTQSSTTPNIQRGHGRSSTSTHGTSLNANSATNNAHNNRTPKALQRRQQRKGERHQMQIQQKQHRKRNQKLPSAPHDARHHAREKMRSQGSHWMHTRKRGKRSNDFRAPSVAKASKINTPALQINKNLQDSTIATLSTPRAQTPHGSNSARLPRSRKQRAPAPRP